MAYLDIHENQYTKENVENISDPVHKAIKIWISSKHFTYQNRIGKNTYKTLFCFNEMTKAEVLKEINSVNHKKASLFNTVSSNILKILPECYLDTLTSLVKKSLTSSRKFRSNFKLADIKPIYKKKDPQAKPVSIDQ